MPLKVLDLESMAFTHGGHTMSNKQCVMPANSISIAGKGYTTVHIPARVAEIAKDEKLVPITQLPEWAHAAFAGMKTFNRIQSRVYDAAFAGADNMLMCAPTGAGKTNVAMLAIMHELAMHRNDETGEINLQDFKVCFQLSYYCIYLTNLCFACIE
jgi:pre-mRNA-splicing helicase BRR2